jgi:hypothetical protein
MATAKKNKSAAPRAEREAIYTGPLEEVEVEGVGTVLAEQVIPDTHPAWALVSKHPEFTTRKVA